uniref:ELYS domain-containing protein n=1 Tax=Macrostomum lignano TaxID=282301 RepID=A0A1I8FQB9_9PLAT
MNLLYLWICRGSRDRKSLSSSQSESSSNGSDPVACVHYDTLVSAGVSFSQCLALSGGESTNSRLIHCDNFFTRQSINNDEDLSRAYFVWTECSGSILHVGVFDLNRWYQCQLPRTAKYSLRSLHPYFAVHRLELQRHLLSSGLRLLGGPAPFVTQFQPGLNPRPGAAPAEQLFYPASLGYRIRLHCPPHALLLRCDGAQRAHLDLIGRLSPDSLMARADELADRSACCHRRPSSAAESDDVVGENDSDARRRLLTVCLEHIRDDALPTLGCGQYSALVIDWLWASVRRYKHLLDSATAGLFSVDNQQDDVDEDEVIKDVDADAVADDSRVVQLVTLLDRLDELLRRLLDCRPASSAAVADLRCRADAVSRLCAYARRLQWCARARLLPPGRLAPVFRRPGGPGGRRQGSRALVVVDCLIERLFSYDAAPAGHCVDIDSVGAKAESPVSMTYPPADARHLLESVFLRAPAGCDPRLQHCLFAYLLMDLQALLEDADDAEELTEQWDGYLSVSGQPSFLARWANLLWSLDHSLWPEALSLLDDPDLSRAAVPRSSRRRSLGRGRVGSQRGRRCLIRFRPHAQVSPALAVRVLLASGRPDLALDLIIRPIGDSAERADLLARLLNECAASDRWRGKLFAGIHWPAQLSDRCRCATQLRRARKRLVDIVLDSLPRVQRDLLRLEIAQQAAGTSYIAALPTRRTVDPKPLAAHQAGFASLAGVNPFGTSVTTEKLFANVVATREQERQAWLKA